MYEHKASLRETAAVTHGFVQTVTVRRALECVADELMDWDSAYRELGRFEGPPPSNIGESQRELTAPAAAGKSAAMSSTPGAVIHANVPPAPLDSDFPMPAHDRDEKGRMKLPAYLLTAHKGG